MATLEAAAASSANGNPTSPVPLDTIPISPAAENDDKEGSQSKAQNPDEPVTVFHDKDNFNVKHPLMNEWTLWFTKPPSGKVHL